MEYWWNCDCSWVKLWVNSNVIDNRDEILWIDIIWDNNAIVWDLWHYLGNFAVIDDCWDTFEVMCILWDELGVILCYAFISRTCEVWYCLVHLDIDISTMIWDILIVWALAMTLDITLYDYITIWGSYINILIKMPFYIYTYAYLDCIIDMHLLLIPLYHPLTYIGGKVEILWYSLTTSRWQGVIL